MSPAANSRLILVGGGLNLRRRRLYLGRAVAISVGGGLICDVSDLICFIGGLIREIDG